MSFSLTCCVSDGLWAFSQVSDVPCSFEAGLQELELPRRSFVDSSLAEVAMSKAGDLSGMRTALLVLSRARRQSGVLHNCASMAFAGLYPGSRVFEPMRAM